MIDSSVVLSAIASATPQTPALAETAVRSAPPNQASILTERSSRPVVARYFRFNLSYDPADQQLYFVFKNPITGAVIDEAPSVRSVRSPNSFRSTQYTDQVFTAGSAPASNGAAPSGSSGSKGGAPAAPAASSAPVAPGASSVGAQGRGGAIDSRI